jgi:hypothetical protein
VRSSGKSLDYFAQMARLWSADAGLTKYMGEAQVIYSDGSKSPMLNVFVNRASFLQEVELGFDSTPDSLTFFFFNVKGEDVPRHVVQRHGSHGQLGKTVATYATTVQMHCHVHEWPEKEAALTGSAEVSYSDSQREQRDPEFFRHHCMAEYSEAYRSRVGGPVYRPRPEMTR